MYEKWDGGGMPRRISLKQMNLMTALSQSAPLSVFPASLALATQWAENTS